MYPNIPLWASILFLALGLALLAWSADAFVGAAGKVARKLGVSPFIIGMVIIGFGTSAPELCVSALSGASGHSNLSLGNAYGSAIFNIAGILGIAALIRPLVVKPAISLVAAPALVAISVFSCALVGLGGGFSRADGVIELVAFAVLLPLYCWFEQRNNPSASPSKAASADESAAEVAAAGVREWVMLALGLVTLVGSSHVLVWGSVDIARSLGVSELMIGLTIVAIGTSLPELASAVVSARKGEHEFVLGNIVGSNFFNILAVVGLAGTISPFKDVSAYIVRRDLPVMVALSLSITFLGVNWRSFRQNGVISRLEGALWLLSFLIYAGIMIAQELP